MRCFTDEYINKIAIKKAKEVVEHINNAFELNSCYAMDLDINLEIAQEEEDALDLCTLYIQTFMGVLKKKTKADIQFRMLELDDVNGIAHIKIIAKRKKGKNEHE